MDQPIPSVSEADVERIIARDFTSDQKLAVHSILASLDAGPGVSLACLKLARGNLDELRTAVIVASKDWRDVLAPAEYPGWGEKIGLYDASPDLQEAIVKSDWEQYQAWLARV